MGAQVVDKFDQLEDVHATVEANRLAIEHSELTRTIGQRVKQSLGENAGPAASQGITDLEKETKAILTRASPRARARLEADLGQRLVAAKDGWLTHGFAQTSEALVSSSNALVNRTLEDASDIDDETEATKVLSGIVDPIKKVAGHLGKNDDWVKGEVVKNTSTFFKSRALKLATGPQASASSTIEYATKKRAYLSDDDYNAIVSAYTRGALEEMVVAEQDGVPLASATVNIEEPVDVLAPLPDGTPAPALVARRLDPKAYFRSLIVQNEGTEYVIDNNGRGVKFGFNAAWHPGGEAAVKKLTLESGAEYFANNHWKRSGAGDLAPALAAIHMDTFFLNEKQAMKFLKDSDGDPDRYMAMRREFLQGLHRKNPAKYPDYESRNKRVEEFALRQGGGIVVPPVPINTVAPAQSIEAYRAATMARKDIGLQMKTMLIDRYGERTRGAVAVQKEQEVAVGNGLQEYALQLGDKFTDVKQLPQDLWTAAPISVRQEMTNQAEANVRAIRAKPLTPEQSAAVAYLSTTTPEKFSDMKFLRGFAAKHGIPTAKLAELAELGGRAQGEKDKQTPHYVTRETLMGTAQRAFEARGIRIFTTDTPGDKKSAPARAKETTEEAQRRQNLEMTLMDSATRWAQANPGKVADQQTIHSWIGAAMIRVEGGIPFGTLNKSEVIQRMSSRDKADVTAILRRGNVPVTPDNIATYYQRRYMDSRSRRYTGFGGGQ